MRKDALVGQVPLSQVKKYVSAQCHPSPGERSALRRVIVIDHKSFMLENFDRGVEFSWDDFDNREEDKIEQLFFYARGLGEDICFDFFLLHNHHRGIPKTLFLVYQTKNT